jgi:subtilase family serine protease
VKRVARTRARRGLIAIIAAASALILNGALAVSADAAVPARVALPDPNFAANPEPSGATAAPANPQLTMVLRVYLSGRDPKGQATAALAVSDPRNLAYARYLTPAQYEQRFGPSPAQISAVRDWLTSAGATITAASQHYITVTATVAQVDAALDTQITAYTATFTNLGSGTKFTVVRYGVTGGFSVPAALGGDVTTVTGFDEFASDNEGTVPSTNTPTRPSMPSAGSRAAANSMASATPSSPQQILATR